MFCSALWFVLLCFALLYSALLCSALICSVLFCSALWFVLICSALLYSFLFFSVSVLFSCALFCFLLLCYEMESRGQIIFQLVLSISFLSLSFRSRWSPSSLKLFLFTSTSSFSSSPSLFYFLFFHSRMISASEQICRRLICWQELCSDVSPCTPCRCSTRLKTLKVSSRETPLQLRKHSSCCWVFFSSWCSLDQWGSWRINVFSPGSPL